MVGFCHLTDSHHYHHGQKPTMVGICHGGNMPVGHDGDDDDDDGWVGGWDPGVEGQVSSPTLEVLSFDFTSNSW